MGFGGFMSSEWGWLLLQLLEVGKQHREEVDRDRAWIGNSATIESSSSGLAYRAAGAWSSYCLSLFPHGVAPSLIIFPSL